MCPLPLPPSTGPPIPPASSNPTDQPPPYRRRWAAARRISPAAARWSRSATGDAWRSTMPRALWCGTSRATPATSSARSGSGHCIGRASAQRANSTREQGDYWEMHDVLFQTPRALAPRRSARRGAAFSRKEITMYRLRLESYFLLGAALLAACESGPDPAAIKLQAMSFANSEWSEPVNLGPTINTGFNEQGPNLSKDGLTLYFGSDRPGGVGSFDLWVARRACADCPWDAPVNPGPVVNTTASETGPGGTVNRAGRRH